MTTVANALRSSTAQGHLRPLNVRRDLGAIANLVELCFADTLDPEGRKYLREMRAAARSERLLRWFGSLGERGPTPISGYVWEQDSRLVGNLSLIPLLSQGNRRYLIANVAVHPQYRGRGIARAMTVAAMEYARGRKVKVVWLQVRHDNPLALHLYTSLGFKERAQRTTWNNTRDVQAIPPPAGVVLGQQRYRHWAQQHTWLERLYPPEMEWHLRLDRNALQPGLWGALYRLFTFNYPRHWIVERHGQLEGALTWVNTASYTDHLWLAVPETIDEEALLALFTHARRRIPRHRPLSLNLPAGLASETLLAAGFFPRQTLIWMEYAFA